MSILTWAMVGALFVGFAYAPTLAKTAKVRAACSQETFRTDNPLDIANEICR